ncbi:MAG TPA: DUF4178 domain-containing protein [Bryobacteraceae bacterium]|nr:DUF4178 domain-containing protein [Bryobacteraceae bacterium]
MSQPSAICPNCGAPIRFRWSSAIQTTCEYCKSILVRHDVNLEKVGQVADLPPDISPIQIGTEGVYRNTAFQVIGRIIYSHDIGAWNEWHLIFSNGSSGWLSDAQAEYAVSFLSQPESPLPGPGEIYRGWEYSQQGVRLAVTTLTEASYEGVEGELPFTYWDKERCRFADLRSVDGRFATIDYTEAPPLLFLGEFVEFESLRLTNLKEFEGWTA